MLIALCSDKGSPGVTTTALALGSAWATRVVVVEADLAGGDLSIRLRPNGAALPEAPTLLTVATAARAHPEPDVLSKHAHALSARVGVVPAPIGHEQMASVGDWAPLTDALADSEIPILADLGRLHADSPVLGIAARADLLILVGRPDATSVIRMRDRLARMAGGLAAVRREPARFFPVLVTLQRHGEGDVHDLLAVLGDTGARPFIAGGGYLALDPTAVRRLEAGEDPAGRLARTDLLRSARTLAAAVRQAAIPASMSARSASVGGSHA
jgi:hypothetical protein